MNAAALWQKLVARGVAGGEMPAVTEPAAAWFVRALVAFAAWIAAVFLLAAMGALVYWALEWPPGPLLLGSALCYGGRRLVLRDTQGLFFAQLGLALLLAGEGLVVFGIVRAVDGHSRLSTLAFLLVAAFETFMVWWVPHAAHRALAALFAVAALLGAAWDLHILSALPPLVAAGFAGLAFAGAASPRQQPVLEPASTGVALALLLFAPAMLVGGGLLFDDPQRLHGVGRGWAQALTVLILAGTAVQIARRYPGVAVNARGAAVAAATLFALAAWPVPGVSAALVVMLVAFALGRIVLCGLAVVTLLGMLSHYYYTLDTTLLVKSLSLLAAGGVLLLAGGALLWRGRVTGGGNA